MSSLVSLVCADRAQATADPTAPHPDCRKRHQKALRRFFTPIMNSEWRTVSTSFQPIGCRHRNPMVSGTSNGNGTAARYRMNRLERTEIENRGVCALQSLAAETAYTVTLYPSEMGYNMMSRSNYKEIIATLLLLAHRQRAMKRVRKSCCERAGKG
ncbi:hypothetical protein VTK56DRAFT_9004 [Thermocarpiscus australiensis]